MLARTAASVVINNFVQVWNDPAEPSFVIFDERHLPQFVLDEGAMTIPSVSCKTPANLKKWKATTAFIGSFGSQLVDLKTSELIAFINREAPYPNLVDEKLVKAFQKRASKFSDVDYSSVEYNVFDGWTFKEKGVLSAPVAITIGQFTGHTLTPRQRKATVLFVELHGEKLVTLQQDDVPDFVTQQVSVYYTDYYRKLLC